MDLSALQKNLERRGFVYRYFETAAQVADYLVESICGKTVGVGGSMTIDSLNVFDRLCENNTVYWHWKAPGPETLAGAASAQVYLSSLNGIAETGELINIDGSGNRIAATLFGRERVCFIAGVNKVAEDYDKALWRARNVAAPLNARRLERKTPCARGELKCHDCRSPERICRGLTVLWEKMSGVQTCEVILVGEKLGY